NFDTAITGLLGAALDALAAARAGSDAQLHLANLVLALTSRTARCASGSSAVAMGRGFASQILAVPVGEEIDRMYPGASEAAGGGAEAADGGVDGSDGTSVGGSGGGHGAGASSSGG